MSWAGWVLLAYVAAVSVPLAIIDVRQHRLPNKLVVPGIALAVVCGVLAAGMSGWHDWMPLIGLGSYFALMLLLSLLGGLGMGDVKLAALLGAAAGFLGGEAVFATVALSFIAGGLAAAALWLAQRRGRIPFGPFMLLGYWVVVALSPRLGA